MTLHFIVKIHQGTMLAREVCCHVNNNIPKYSTICLKYHNALSHVRLSTLNSFKRYICSFNTLYRHTIAFLLVSDNIFGSTLSLSH